MSGCSFNRRHTEMTAAPSVERSRTHLFLTFTHTQAITHTHMHTHTSTYPNNMNKYTHTVQQSRWSVCVSFCDLIFNFSQGASELNMKRTVKQITHTRTHVGTCTHARMQARTHTRKEMTTWFFIEQKRQTGFSCLSVKLLTSNHNKTKQP